MKGTLIAGGFALALLAGLVPVFATVPPDAPMRSAQRRGGAAGGARQCPGGQDSECSSMPLPRPQACPGGAQRTPSACCRMNFCGICWTDCPAH